MIDTELQEAAKQNFASIEVKLIRELSFFGRFLHMHGGGNGSRPHLLTLIYAQGGEVEQKELIDTTKIKSASLSEALSKLEAEGAVVRERKPDDKRSVLVTLTAYGESQAEELARERIAFTKSSFQALSETEKAQLLETLTTLHTSWLQTLEKEKTCEI